MASQDADLESSSPAPMISCDWVLMARYVTRCFVNGVNLSRIILCQVDGSYKHVDFSFEKNELEQSFHQIMPEQPATIEPWGESFEQVVGACICFKGTPHNIFQLLTRDDVSNPNIISENTNDVASS